MPFPSEIHWTALMFITISIIFWTQKKGDLFFEMEILRKNISL